MPIWKMKRRSVLTKGRFAKINRRFAMSETLFRQGCFAKGTKKRRLENVPKRLVFIGIC